MKKFIIFMMMILTMQVCLSVTNYPTANWNYANKFNITNVQYLLANKFYSPEVCDINGCYTFTQLNTTSSGSFTYSDYFNQNLNTTNDVTFNSVSASIDASYIQGAPWITDYTETDTLALSAINDLNQSKMNITDQRYNDTNAINLKQDNLTPSSNITLINYIKASQGYFPALLAPDNKGFIYQYEINTSGGEIVIANNEVHIESEDAPDTWIYHMNCTGGTSGSGGIPNLTQGYNVTNYVYCDYNNGNPIFNITINQADINNHNKLQYATIEKTSATGIHPQENGWNGFDLAEETANDLQYPTLSGYRILSGFNTITISTDLNVTLGGGDSKAGSWIHSIPTTSNNTRNYQIFHNADGSPNATNSLNKKINNTYYDNGTAWVEINASLPYVCVEMWHGVEHADHSYFVTSDETYQTLELALASPLRSTTYDKILDHALNQGRCCFGKGNTTFDCQINVLSSAGVGGSQASITGLTGSISTSGNNVLQGIVNGVGIFFDTGIWNYTSQINNLNASKANVSHNHDNLSLTSIDCSKIIGGSDSDFCADATGEGAGDGNNYTTGIFVSGTTTKNITLTRYGMPNISTTFTDETGGTGSLPTDLELYSRQKYYKMTDFESVTAVYNTPWVLGAIASGTAPLIAGTPYHPGIVQFTSSTSASSGYTYNIAGATTYSLNANMTVEAVIRPYTKTGNLTNIKFGFTDVITGADSVDGVYFNITQATTTLLNISLVGISNSVSVVNKTSITLTNNTWYTLKVYINSTSLATGMIYDETGTLIWNGTVATVPNGVGRETSTSILCWTVGGTTAQKLCDVDFLSIGFVGRMIR